MTSLGTFILLCLVMENKRICCKEIPVKQYPSHLSVQPGHSAAIICTFELSVTNGNEIDVYWVKQVNQREIYDVLHISSKRFPTLNTNTIRNGSERSFSFSGNLRRGLIVLEIKNIKKTDFGLYICKVTRTIPPPPMEGRGSGTTIVEYKQLTPKSESRNLMGELGAENATYQHQHSVSENVLITIIANLVIYAVIMTVLTLVCWIYRRRSRETQRDSSIYEEMNIAKNERTQVRTRN
ncbi:T-cell-specific surface glycoprotein CD28 homolog [Heterodontus francisci]|uniref:T-cell-specific surface glycoprotein CD28 homolog n=1 Tax=Heterodontus francisci TaxID=7792 RepID=UPI00355B4AF1